jgi:hypothetical protein
MSLIEFPLLDHVRMGRHVWMQLRHLCHSIETLLQHVQYPDLFLKHSDATLATYR